MTGERLTTSRLFTTSVVEGRIDLDEKYDKAYNYVMSHARNLSEKERHDVLNKLIDENKKHEDVCIGLLVGILSEPAQAQQYFHDLLMICRDGLKIVCDALIQNIIGERYQRLMEVSRKQVVWLVRKLVQAGVSPAEGVVWCLLRQMAGGDISPRNIWLAESLCDMFRENRPWLERFNIIIASVVYSFLRILEDHQQHQFAALRQKEVNLVVSLLRERFSECLAIGRDLIRLLQNVAKIPEIEAFWKDLIHNPTSLAPNFQGIVQILSSRTSRRYLVVRLTPDMEKQIYFLCSEVKFGTQKRYQDWFQKQFLNTPESQTLRCDLIRFIIGCIHPPNEVLCSDIIPRWAVIGWLLSSCTNPIATANCKLALFYDWLFFSGENDNIMNIEPGILVMYHSIKPHPMLTASLLDFLCRIIPHFHPNLTTQVRTGVTNSLKQILDKRVIQNIEPLFDNQRWDSDLRRLIRDTFPVFCSTIIHEEFPQHGSNSSSVTKMDLMAETGLDFPHSSSNEVELNNHQPSVDEDAAFSDEDDESMVPSSRLGSNNKSNSVRNRTSGGGGGFDGGPPPGYSTALTSTTTSSTPHISTSLISSIIHSSNNILSTSSISKTLSSSVSYTNTVVNSMNVSSTNKSSCVNNNSSKNSTIVNSNSNDDIIELDTRINNSVSVNGSQSLVNGGRTPDDALRTTNSCGALAMSSEQSGEFNEYLNALEPDMRDYLLDFKTEKEPNKRSEVLQKVCDLVLSDDLDESECDNLAGALGLLLSCCSPVNSSTLLPQHITTQSLCSSLEAPIFILFEKMVRVNEDDHRRHSLLQLLASLQKHFPSAGYSLLYYMKAKSRPKNKYDNNFSFQIYKDLWKCSGQKDLGGFIVRDMSACSEDDPRLLCWLLPHLYTSFPKHTTGNVELLHLVLQRLDAAQLHDLVCLVLQGTLTMFDNSSFASILDKSLSWESVEQFFLWQLAHAHEIPVDCCLSVLHKLEFTSHAHPDDGVHAEALANILMMLRRESPSETLLRHLLQRELRPQDPTVATILQYWVQRYEDKMAKLINDIVNNKPPPSPNKRKRNQAGPKQNSHVTLDQLLSHLNHMRYSCDQTKFFSLSTMQESLVTAQTQCSDGQKKAYKELFELIVATSDDEKASNDGGSSVASSAPPRSKPAPAKRGRKPKIRKKPESESEDESSEEEDVKKPARKRKKNLNAFTSDSD